MQWANSIQSHFLRLFGHPILIGYFCVLWFSNTKELRFLDPITKVGQKENESVRQLVLHSPRGRFSALFPEKGVFNEDYLLTAGETGLYFNNPVCFREVNSLT